MANKDIKFVVENNNNDFVETTFEPEANALLGSDLSKNLINISDLSDPKRIYYDTLVVRVGDSISVIPPRNERLAPFVYDNLKNGTGSYTKTLYEVRISNSVSYGGLSFSSESALMSWLTSHLGNSGGFFTVSASIRPYDVIDYSIPTFYKVYGFNRLYSGLVGNRYKSSLQGSLDDGVINWSGGSTFICNVVNFMLSPATPFTPQDFTSPSKYDHGNLVWRGKYSKLYGIPPDGKTKIFAPRSNRKVYDSKSQSILYSPITYRLSTPRVFIYTSYDHIYNGYIENPAQPQTTLKLSKWKSIFNAHPAIIVYSVESDVYSSYRAIYMKPMGITEVVLNWFDSSLYDLEVLYLRKNKQKSNINLISSSNLKYFSVERDSVTVPYHEWNCSNIRRERNDRAYENLSFKFRLRKKNTNGSVGDCSNGSVYLDLKGSHNFGRFLVK